MKKINLLRMVVCLLLSVFLMTACSSTEDDGFDDEPELVTEVEDAISDELAVADSDDDEGFDDGDDDVAEESSNDEGFDDDVAEESSNDEGFDDDGDEDFGGDESVADSSGDDFGDDEDFGDDDDFGDDTASNDGGDDFDSFDAEETVSEALNQDASINEPVGDGFDINEPTDEPTQPVVVAEPEAPAGQSVSVSSIDFKSSEGGGGIIMIKTSAQASISQRENPEKRQMMIDIENATIPSSLKRPFIMKDFTGTPFAGLNAYDQDDGNTVSIVVQMKQGYGLPGIQQEGNSIIVLANGGLAPIQAEAEPAPEDNYVQPVSTGPQGIMSAANFSDFLMNNQRYYGRPISIQASNVDIRDLINFISEESGANIIVSSKVAGETSLKLRDVPWDQALVTLMKSHSLGYVREGSILRIATLGELENITKMVNKSQEVIDNLRPKKVRMFTINFADVFSIHGNITKLLSPKTGIATVDKRTNNLIVTDTEAVLSKIESIIKQLDVEPAQVMIEGKIVEAQENFIQKIGVRWGAENGASEFSATGGPSGSPVLMRPTVRMNSTSSGEISGAAGLFSLSIGTLKSLGDLTASLALSENENLTKILSSPRIIAMNKESAEISQQTEVLTVTSSVSNGVVSNSVERKPVSLKLSVTPQITNNGKVMMDFAVSRGFPGPVEDTQTLARAVNSRSAKSKILVNSGETAVIGGIYDSLGLTGESGPIGLKDIPILGWLFKSKVKENRKNELIIFLTPKILNKG